MFVAEELPLFFGGFGGVPKSLPRLFWGEVETLCAAVATACGKMRA